MADALRVKFTAPANVGGRVYRPGAVADVDRASALALMGSGRAVPVAAAAAPAPNRAASPDATRGAP
ncbi:hypothetical protein [Oceanicella actignis]|uniref:Uncharacterized protein n=1 Tax=Oceanicella actignis TaxID=1189325 RepID=A0A1M7U1J4_9RHOB|nr:hypothetical protein [Oceanicella actignis]SES76659.1 hypothetical protein SAMN04488119_101399 [Oceanicella actignis]SHN76932.1 hypothetical protein SAMN05216200_11423 [Oceanicella actignis]